MTSLQNWNAKDYAKQSSAQYKWAMEIMDTIDLKGDEDVLDIGCGDGKITAIYADNTKGSVLGIDSSPEMISLAKDSYQDVPNLNFVEANAVDFSLEKTFDIIVSNSCLHWVHDHFSVLKCIKKHLNPGGRVLLQMGGKGNIRKFLKLTNKQIKRTKWSKYFQDFSFSWAFYGREDYEPWINNIGFGVNRIEVVPKDMQHNNRKELEGYLRTVWLPYVNSVPENMRDEFVNELVGGYLEEVPLDENGRTHVEMTRLVVDLSL